MEWKPVHGFEGLYEVSETGLCRNALTLLVLKPGPTAKGYIRYQLWRCNRGKNVFAHHMVLEANGFIKPVGAQCRHLDGCKTNNRLSNLAWGTASENIRDTIRHGTFRSPVGNRKGSDNYSAKLNEPAVLLIKDSKEPARVLAERFGVKRLAIYRIRRGVTWAHVQ